MIREYLLKNQKLVNKKLIEKKELLEHNRIVIDEANSKINKLSTIVDEATEIFSIKGREDSEFNQKQIREIELNNIEIMKQNDIIIREIDSLEKELTEINDCLLELTSLNVSRETLEKLNRQRLLDEEKQKSEQKDKIADKEHLKQKLQFCKSIAGVDGKRVVLELENIIKGL